MNFVRCFHCGDKCNDPSIILDEKNFCCNGCKTVFEIFQANDLTYYYDLQAAAGTVPNSLHGKYDFLEATTIEEKLLEFDDDGLQIVNLTIPHIHCSSCIWILENLNKLHPAVLSSQVDFPLKTVRATFRKNELSLKDLVVLLARIGYEPLITLESRDSKKSKPDRSLLYKLGIAGFAFGNIMFLSFPEYFDLALSKSAMDTVWLVQYQGLFRWLMFAFALPVVFYSGQDYILSAYRGIRAKTLNMDVPIALGILVMFLRSSFDIIFNLGSGFFDSLTGLIFFLLLGKFFQQKTYAFLSFERDYKSYFPLAITRIDEDSKEETTAVNDINMGDKLLIRSEEIIPVDGKLLSESALIDYSFVSGESQPVSRKYGDKIYAGGKQLGGAIELKTLKSVSQSYLTQLWGNNIFKKDKSSRFQTLTDSLGKRFTYAVLTIAFLATSYWLFVDASKALNVFTAVLIIACPCAIALAAPFALGNMLRIFGKKRFYLKDTLTIEQLALVNTAIFDKTGTISYPQKSKVSYHGLELTTAEESLLKNTLRASNHPLSRTLYKLLADQNIVTLDDYYEQAGKGIEGAKDNSYIKIGSSDFVGNPTTNKIENTSVHISTNDIYKGCFVFHNEYRAGISELFKNMKETMDLAILSGDNTGEKPRLEKMLPKLTPLYFNQKPIDKLQFIKELQLQDKNVMMVGDGLNDAGALAQSNVGIAISENVNVFSPACDGILDATKFNELNSYVQASKKAMNIIRISFVFSLLYNLIGLYFAVTGQLEPVVAAILMPLSSISIVVFTTVATNIIGRKLK